MRPSESGTPLDPALDGALDQALGYLNFSAGAPDPQFLGNLNRLFAAALDTAGDSTEPPWRTVVGWLTQRLTRLRGSTPAFSDTAQVDAVLGLIRSEPRKAERALEDLAELFRVLMAENNQLSTLWRELELARNYLALEELRLGERLKIDWHTDKAPMQAAIPPLILQPLLENAVYHGIEPHPEVGVISVNIYRSRNELHIDIRNPFHNSGESHHIGNKMAMANIRERLLLFFDAEASLKTSVGSNYYQVHIVLPFRE